MGVATPEVSGLAMIQSMTAAAASLAAVRTQTGDLTFRQINDMISDLSDAELAFSAFQVDLTIAPTVSMEYLSARGGPSDVAVLAAAAAVIKPAVAAWRAEVDTALATLTASDVVAWVARNHTSGVDRNTLEQRGFLPASIANGLRGSQQLTDIANAISTLGI